jgi:purine-binding chemotaxis protein CheW
MTNATDELATHAALLREAFDRAFAEAPVESHRDSEDFLALNVGGDDYAVRLNEISGLFEGKRWRALPGAAPALLGIAGFRGALVPIYDLNALLGYAPATSPRWLVLIKTHPSVGLAFERLDGHLRVSREALSSEADSAKADAPVRETLREANAVRGVLHLPTILETIKNRARRTSPKKE